MQDGIPSARPAPRRRRWRARLAEGGKHPSPAGLSLSNGSGTDTRATGPAAQAGSVPRPRLPRRAGGAAVLLLAALAACARPADPLLRPDALGNSSLAGQLIRSDARTPPSDLPGQCWADAVTPAVVETETVHELVSPARPATATSPAQEPVYRTIEHQRIVKDRAHVWFRTPCPAVMTADFIGSLQRALLARGYYNGPLTGRMDPPTRAGLRRFQNRLGLDSEILALGTARELGLVRYDLSAADRGNAG